MRNWQTTMQKKKDTYMHVTVNSIRINPSYSKKTRLQKKRKEGAARTSSGSHHHSRSENPPYLQAHTYTGIMIHTESLSAIHFFVQAGVLAEKREVDMCCDGNATTRKSI
jgi:hypothetical protein